MTRHPLSNYLITVAYVGCNRNEVFDEPIERLARVEPGFQWGPNFLRKKFYIVFYREIVGGWVFL